MNNSQTITFAIILIIAFLVTNWWLIKKTNFLRESGKPNAPYSWARSQLFMWTFLVLVITVTHWIVNGWKTFELNDTCLVLLGITSASAVASMAIPASRKVSKNKAIYAFKDTNESHHWFHDILKDENDMPSMSRLQHVLFTFIYFAVFVTTFIIANGADLPELNEKAYLLMGISGGTYVVNKGLTMNNENAGDSNADSTVPKTTESNKSGGVG